MLKTKTSARMLALAGATALVVGAMSGSQAATTSDIAVTATVTARCDITTTQAVAFGAYDPLSVTDATTTGILSVTCTNGSDATVTLDEGDHADTGSTAANPSRQMSDGETVESFLGYALYTDAGYQTEWDGVTGQAYTGTGTAGSLTVYAVLPAEQNVPAGSYSDTVVATITL